MLKAAPDIDELAKSFEVIAPSHPGFDGSDLPDHVSTVDDLAYFYLDFLDALDVDDVVIIDNEWGRIEDIRLTYVVVRIWDDRRLVVPVSKFLENSFQNWTRETSALLGSVFWYLDPAADVPRIRAKLEEVVRAVLDHEAVVDHHDAVGHARGLEPVRNEHRGPAA